MAKIHYGGVMQTTAPRTFISFDFDNNSDHKVLFAGQAKNSQVPFSIADWSSKTALPQTTWQAHVSAKIAKCEIMVVLVGKQTSWATGVAKEIEMAINHGVPFFGVYVDGANANTPLPAGLARNRVVGWEWSQIAHAINVVSKEGRGIR